jgi:hypothetical protein
MSNDKQAPYQKPSQITIDFDSPLPELKQVAPPKKNNRATQPSQQHKKNKANNINHPFQQKKSVVWQKLPLSNPVNLLLLAFSILSCLFCLYIQPPLPNASALFTSYPASTLAFSLSEGIYTFPVMLNLTAISLLCISSLFGVWPAIIIAGTLLIAQVIGIEPFANMGNFNQPGPTWGYGPGLMMSAIVMAKLLMPRSKKKPTFNATPNNTNPEKDTSITGSVVRMKRQQKKIGGLAGFFHNVFGGIGHICRQSSLFVRMAFSILQHGFRLTGYYLKPSSSNQPVGQIRFILQLCIASIISLGALHLTGLIGLYIWHVWQMAGNEPNYLSLINDSWQATLPWTNATATQQWLYEWVIIVTLLAPTYLIRQKARYILY